MDRHGTMQHLFGARRALIGMIHVGALPGTPRAGAPLERVIETAVAEARAYRDCGYTALMIENMHDRPYLKGAVGPEMVAAMTAVGQRGAPRGGAAAGRAGAGRGEPRGDRGGAGLRRRLRAGRGLRVRARRRRGPDRGLGRASCCATAAPSAPSRCALFADIKKKHSAHALTADVDIVETARAAEFFLADGVVVTGPVTARAADTAEVEAVAGGIGLPDASSARA